ncbi:MAG: cupredoxin domain-containing protein [Actinomycetota bacterium]|nr:cupredoxin domain-containing protein [Actinomycetota bacterium]
MKFKSAVLVVMAALGLVLAGCGTSGRSNATSPKTAPDTIVIKNFTFVPARLTVAPGATVTVHNEDSATHTVTGKPFDTGDIRGGTTTTFTAPGQPGTYPYMCTIHQYMTGTLVVS